MRDRMRPGLFEEWLAFAQLEPFGERSQDEHLAYVLTVLVNAITGGKVVGRDKRQAFTSDEFLIRHGEPPRGRRRSKERRLSVAETVQHVTDLMALAGGAVPTDLRRLPPKGGASRG